MKVTRVAHVSLNVEGNLEETKAFYNDLFELEDHTGRPEIPGVPGHWQHIGPVELHLVGAAPRGTAIDPTGPHFCLYVSDLDAAIHELEERSIPYVRGAQGPVVQIWVTDPAGNTVELQQERA